MPASAILSAPAPLAGAASLPLSEAGTILPAAAGFGALIDARTALAPQPSLAASVTDLSGASTRAAGVVQPADVFTDAMAEAGVTPAPVLEAGETLTLPTKPQTAGQHAVPALAKSPAPPAQTVGDAEAAPSEPSQPSIGRAELLAQPPSPAADTPMMESVPPPEEAPRLEKVSADEAAPEAGGGEGAAPLVAATPPAPVPSVGQVQPPAQPASAITVSFPGADTDAPEAVHPTKGLKAEKQAPLSANGLVSGGKDTPVGEVVRPAAQGAAFVPADAPVIADQPDGRLPAPLLTQTMVPVTSRPAAVYPPAAQVPASASVVQAQSGRMGADIGVEIARAAKGEREDLLIRLDPRDMGRINVRLSFDGEGVLRAVVSADSPGALEMLRRESGDLNRALADAGIRSDAQSLRFDARSGDQGHSGGQSGQRGQQPHTGGSQSAANDGPADLAEPHYRPLRSSGQVDLMA